jgi:hypothetical protein
LLDHGNALLKWLTASTNDLSLDRNYRAISCIGQRCDVEPITMSNGTREMNGQGEP